MREILFRAWLKAERKMVDVRVINFVDRTICYNEEKHPFFTKDCVMRVAKFDDIELMQFTDLFDTDGVKIFEGDIIKCVDKHSDCEFIAVVEFGNPNGVYSWGWQLRYIRGDKLNTDILCWVEMEETGAYTEAIGNIYDNPELLEEKK